MCESIIVQRQKMSFIEFNEEELQDIEKLGNRLFNKEGDPTSYSYKRLLVRPNINWGKIALSVFIPVVLFLILAYILVSKNIPNMIIVLMIVTLILAYMLINIKAAIICMIHIYQRYAPETVRNKCRFEPSCSQYMILVIQKYGLIKGIKKGINRLKRCNIRNGGYDFP